MNTAKIPKIVGIRTLLLLLVAFFSWFKLFIIFSSDVLLFSSLAEEELGNDGDIPLTTDNLLLLLLLLLENMDGLLLGDVDILGLTSNTAGLELLLLTLFVASSIDVEGEMDACIISLFVMYKMDGKLDGWFVVAVVDDINDVGWFEGLYEYEIEGVYEYEIEGLFDGL